MTTDEVLDDAAFRLWFAFYWPDRDLKDIERYRRMWRKSMESDHFKRIASEALLWSAYNRTMALAAQARGETPPELALPPDGWGGNES